jgi:hypothetical protein
MSNKAQQSNWVTAVFQNAAVCIELAHQPTLARLAEQLGARRDSRQTDISGPDPRTILNL